MLQGQQYHIAPNLELFLRQAISHAKDPADYGQCGWDGGWLRVDSLCINQDDNDEKSHQVIQMKQIYEKATKIIVWLGLAAEEKEQGLRLISVFKDHEPRTPSNTNEEWEQEETEEQWNLRRDTEFRGLPTMTSRAYWRRVWIIQEATTPKSSDLTMVWCGKFYTKLDIFAKAADLCLRLSRFDSQVGSLHDASAEAFQWLQTIKRHRVNSAEGIDLYLMLPYVQFTEANDQRDKVFALVPLTSEEKVEVLKPNYQIHAKDLFKSLATYLIERDRSLDILGFCGRAHNLTLPSWVPDWTVGNLPKAFRRRSLSNTVAYKNLYSASQIRGFNSYANKDNGLLHVEGFKFDSVDSVGMPRSSSTSEDSDVESNWKTLTILRWSRYVTGCTWQEALAHTMCTDVKTPSDNFQIGKRGASIHIPEHNAELGLFVSPDRIVRDVTVSRRHFYSSKDYIGLAPHDTEAGDIICIFSGSQFPVILRQDGQFWELVGEAYIHGIMDGEAADWGSRGHRQR